MATLHELWWWWQRWWQQQQQQQHQLNENGDRLLNSHDPFVIYHLNTSFRSECECEHILSLNGNVFIKNRYDILRSPKNSFTWLFTSISLISRGTQRITNCFVYIYENRSPATFVSLCFFFALLFCFSAVPHSRFSTKHNYHIYDLSHSAEELCFYVGNYLL